ncbi:MAG: hypothetical protein ABIM59_07955 [candidate division WOR-3 bacterium]
MKWSEFEKLNLHPGMYVVVTWYDAAEIRRRQNTETLTDEEAITPVQTMGEYRYIHVSPFHPLIEHVVIYEGERGGRHVFVSIPLPLIVSIEVLKRRRMQRKTENYVLVLKVAGGEKCVLRRKH